MEDFVVTCQLVPSVSHLRSGSCTSPRTFQIGRASSSEWRPDVCSSDLANLSALSQFLPHAESQGTRKTSRGKTQNCPCVSAGFIKHAPLEGWRTSLSRANSSRACHTSDPVRVPRPALSRSEEHTSELQS